VLPKGVPSDTPMERHDYYETSVGHLNGHKQTQAVAGRPAACGAAFLGLFEACSTTSSHRALSRALTNPIRVPRLDDPI
jgi:hypothetical protein